MLVCIKNRREILRMGGECEMNTNKDDFESDKVKIVTLIAELSSLLGMIPTDNAMEVHAPLTEEAMALSDWLSSVRGSFFKLSLLISRKLDIQLQ